ncbi:hypothetical protein [Capnocytophaga catalasegens]|uniref:Uncharacterized protein n=1 Tax=Capnocytophaga catalasegens TaxID=1004260 RepID=A0AAV5AQ75_9FLAO|nr:hypothetical protein [Capnocytophaga catalasegens]GIZ16277.1 hypothetical protein RCZ03_22770 [Capnocytophaga catalasegens]GJM49484.1 hypothetical protein RCZ15_04590 [Capnocytophaga catalasegens]GJM52851.1 hypothetical protein RCZ16_11680 [Capnocytophaga catalasegens]
MISNVILKNGRYTIYDEKLRELKSGSENSLGDLKGFSLDYALFKKNGRKNLTIAQ